MGIPETSTGFGVVTRPAGEHADHGSQGDKSSLTRNGQVYVPLSRQGREALPSLVGPAGRGIEL